MKDREAVCEKVRAVGLIYQQSVEGDSRDPENKKARKKAGNKHEGNSNAGDDRKYPGWVLRVAIGLEPILGTGISIMPNPLE